MSVYDLTPAERESLRGLGQGQVPDVVVRILTNRRMAAVFESIEYGARFPNGREVAMSKANAEIHVRLDGATLVQRTCGATPDRYGDWAEVGRDA